MQNRQSKNKLILIALAAALLIIATIAIFIFYRRLSNRSGNASPFPGSPDGSGNVQVTENTITASGTVSPGFIMEGLDLDYLESELVVEEVYLSSGMQVEQGEKIARLTEKSVEKARGELIDAKTEAELAFRAGTITFEQAKIEAQYEYDSNILNGTQAQEIYDETIKELQKAVDDATKDIEEANEDIAEYTDALQNDSYDEKYQVSYLNTKYEEDLALLNDKMEDWELPWQYVTGQDENGDPVNAPINTPNLSTAQKLYQEVDEEYQEYLSAKEEYDTALTNATYELEKLNLKMTDLEGALQTAQSNYDEGVISAKAAYDNAIAKSQNAQAIYNTAIKKAQEEFHSLQDEKEDAEEHLSDFEERVGDTYLYTADSGEILMAPLEEDMVLQKDSMLLGYSNADDLTVMVSVNQDYIDQISVGDKALVTITEYGDYSGTVQSINPISQNSSRSSVTYLVTVKLEGDVTMLSANLAAQVTFGTMTGDDTAG